MDNTEPNIMLTVDSENGKEIALQNNNFPQSRICAVDVNALLSKAIDKETPVETMEKLLAMARQLKADYSLEQFNIALSEFQAACPEIKKTKIVKDKSGEIRYKYAPLEVIVSQVRELIRNYGFSYTIKTEQTETQFTAICEVRHSAGHCEQTSFVIPIDIKAYMGAAQKVGSASTYAKRYAFCNAFGIMTGDEDTDANDLDPDLPKSKYPPSPKGNGVPKMSAEEAKTEILEMLKNDIGGVFSDNEKNDMRTRIANNKPYRGGWFALHEKVKLKIEMEGVAF